MIKKTVYVLVAALLVAGLVLGCAPKAKPAELPAQLRIGTMPAGTTSFAMGSAVAKVVSAHTPMQAVAVPLGTQDAAVEGLRLGSLDLMIGSVAVVWGAYHGTAPFLRTVQGGATMNMAWLVKANTGMTKAADLKGRIVSQVQSPSILLAHTAALANAGLTWNDVKVVPIGVATAEGSDAIKEGRAEAGLISLGSAAAAELDVVTPGGVRFLTQDSSPAAIAKMRDIFPAYKLRLFKVGSVPGILGDTYALCLANYLLAHENVSEDVISTVVKALYENYAEMASVHALLKEWTPAQFVEVEAMAAPYHPGAIRSYKDMKLWSAEAQQSHDKLLKK